MKRQHAEVGVKYWDNQDFIDLQGEPLRALDGFFAQYGPCVVQGCEVTKASASTFDVAPGLVVLEGTDHEGTPVTMIVPFEGVKGVSMPLCLTLDHTIRERVYGDGKVKPIAFDYYAKPSTVAPTDGTPFFEIKETGTLRFVDVIQDTKHRFATDQQQAQWSAKETPEGAQTKAEAALRNAKTYTDQKEGVIRSDMATADTATLRDAKSYADTVVTALVDGSPQALNTLKELAAALGNDPNFATTVLQKIGEKLDYGNFGGDLNGINTSGMYKLLSGCTNVPLGSSQGCFLLHTNWDANAAQQMYFVYSTTDIYVRNKVNGTWKPWQKVWNAGNFNPNTKLNYIASANDNNNEIGVGYSQVSLGGNYNGPFIKFGLSADYMTEFHNLFDQDVFQVRRMNNGVWQAFVNLWHSGNFNPNNYLSLLTGGGVTGNVDVSGYLTADSLRAKAPLYPTISFVKTNDSSESLLIVAGNNLYFRPVASDTTNKLVYHSGNFNPDNYLSLLTGGSVTGGVGVSGYLTAGVLRVKASSYPQISFINTTTNSESLLFVNTNNLYFRPVAGSTTEYLVYHSGNFNPDNYLPTTTPTANGGIVVNGETAVGKRPYLKFHIPGVAYSQFVMDDRGTVSLLDGAGQTPDVFKSFFAGAIFSNGNRVWDSGNFKPDNKLNYSDFKGDLNTINISGIYHLGPDCTHTPNNGNSNGSHIIHTNWDNNAAHQIYLEYYGSMFYRYKHGGEWGNWARVWTQFEFNPDSYLPLTGGKTITGDVTLAAGVRLIEAAKNIIGRFVFGGNPSARTVVGTADVDTLLVSASSVKRHTGGSEFTIYDSGNLGNATTSQAGLMSAADKTKLDGVAANANNYSHPTSHPATMITEDVTHRFATDTEKATWNAKAGTEVATSSAAGLMPAADKLKVDNLPGALAAGRVLSNGSFYDVCGICL